VAHFLFGHGVYTNNYFSIERFNRVIAKNKMALIFFTSQCTEIRD